MIRAQWMWCSIALVGLVSACDMLVTSYGPTWGERSQSYLVYPVLDEYDGVCMVTHLRPRINNTLEGVVAYTRLSGPPTGNQAAWPTEASLCYGDSWYDLQGSSVPTYGADGEEFGYEANLHVIGARQSSTTTDWWPIELSQVPWPGLWPSFDWDFVDTSCERIARIEGAFGDDITIYVVPAAPDCDRVPYSVRYVAQEIYRR